MKKLLSAAAVILAVSGLAACNTPGERAAGGALIGGATGAAIGGLATGRAGGAVAGGLIGAAGGAIIGAGTAQPRGCARWGRDYYGRRVCVEEFY